MCEREVLHAFRMGATPILVAIAVRPNSILFKSLGVTFKNINYDIKVGVGVQ